MTKKTQMQYDKILAFMEEGKEYGIWDFCELLNLKESRTKDILKELADYIEIIGGNKDRKYRKKMGNAQRISPLWARCGNPWGSRGQNRGL